MKTVCVVGAGLSGLVCGMRLSKAGFQVHIVEELTYPGGLIASGKIGKEYLERLPHHLRKTDHALLSLIKEVGLSDKVEWFDSLWHGHASSKKIGYFTNGFAGLVNMLVQDITDNGGQISYSYTVSEITKNTETDIYTTTCVLSNSDRINIESDYVVFTGSCRSFINVSHGLPLAMDIRDQLMNITYKSQISLLMVLKQQVSEVYFKNTHDDANPYQRIINHSKCFGTRGYGGNVIYLVGDCSISDPLWIEDDAKIMDRYFSAFRKIYPSIRKNDIKTWRLTKTRYARAEKYPDTDLTMPTSNVFICASGLTKKSTEATPTNRMEDVVALANDICSRIEFDAEKKSALIDVMNSSEASFVTPIPNMT